MQQEFFARCASGFEGVLAAELKNLGCARVRPLRGGVAFFGEPDAALRACLYSRVATRIQQVLARVAAHDADQLYASVAEHPWEDAIKPDSTIAVHVHGTNKNLRNTQFTALKVKDAVCDRLRQARGLRPNVNASDPDCAIDVSLHESKATLYANLSGASLHRRGYREDGVQAAAPLKETLAAGMLLAAGWGDVARTPSALFADPMCGSGTLAIEAALIAADAAPGLLRTRWGFAGWAGFDAQSWEGLLAQAQQRKQAGIDACRAHGTVVALAGDIDARALSIARSCAQRAGVADLVRFYEGDAASLGSHIEECLGKAAPIQDRKGLLATNPPYGVRLQPDQLASVYDALACAKDALPPAWSMAVITSDAAIDTALGQAADEAIACYNGPLETTVRIYRSIAPRTRISLVSLAGVECSVAVSEANSEQFAARLRKVAKERAKWARQEGVDAYRIYDADLPDYSLAVDCYLGTGAEEGQRYLRVVEYQAPASVDAARADRRFADALALVPVVLDVDPSHVFSKVRKRAKGGGQYREARGKSQVVHVREGGYTFEVDLDAYLDTGLFLDHRITRALVGDMVRDVARGAKSAAEHGASADRAPDARRPSDATHTPDTGYASAADRVPDAACTPDAGYASDADRAPDATHAPRFLNLFAYTGTATVYAAGSGARETTTVDLSQTYLDWARRNMEANGFSGPAHHFVRADVLSWLESASAHGGPYDIVFCDPPTFSNSKAMGKRNFDVQRDHVKLMGLASQVLAEGGTIVFSCNLRSFKLDAEALAKAGLVAENISARTIPRDFERNPKVHSCFIVKKA